MTGATTNKKATEEAQFAAMMGQLSALLTQQTHLIGTLQTRLTEQTMETAKTQEAYLQRLSDVVQAHIGHAGYSAAATPTPAAMELARLNPKLHIAVPCVRRVHGLKIGDRFPGSDGRLPQR